MKSLFWLGLAGLGIYALSRSTRKTEILTGPAFELPDKGNFYEISILLDDSVIEAPNLDTQLSPHRAEFFYVGDREGNASWRVYDLITDTTFTGTDWMSILDNLQLLRRAGIPIRGIKILRDDELVISEKDKV